MRSRIVAAFAVAAALTASGTSARANGRFPAAQYVLVGPGAASDVIVMRTTFGLVVSRDAGATFHWLCEESLQYNGVWDAPVALAADGAIAVGVPDGLVRSADWCVWPRNATLDGSLIADLANDPAGETVLGIESVVGVPNHVDVSHDRGVTFVRAGGGVADELTTVEAAASQPMRVYVSAVAATRAPVLYRSDDEGTTLADTHADLSGVSEVYVAGIDPTNADRVFVRGVADMGTRLLRSTDGAATFSARAMTTGAMLGFALSDDGRRVWYGGPDDGLFRSDDGGDTFTRISDVHVTCLRYHAGSLYLCADWTREPFALARWRDGATAPEPMLAFADIMGPVVCPEGSSVHDTCGARWPAMRAMFTTRPDAGREDAAVDGGGVDAGEGMDGGAMIDASASDGAIGADSAGGDGCRCGVPGARRGRGIAWGWVVAVVAVGLRRKRTPRPPTIAPRERRGTRRSSGEFEGTLGRDRIE